MARKRKHSDAVEMHERNRFMRERQSPTVKDEFPEVTQIRISLTFEDFDNRTHPKPQELNYAQANRAFFELKCPLYECVMGGFNFSAPVREAIRNRLTVTKGTEKCPGWQDLERIHKHGCYLKAHYEIHVQYTSAV